MITKEFQGKVYKEPDKDVQTALHAADIHLLYFYPKEQVWMATDAAAEYLKIDKFHMIREDAVNFELVYKADLKKAAKMYKTAVKCDKTVSENLRNKNGAVGYKVSMTVTERDADGEAVCLICIIENYEEQMKHAGLEEMLSVDYDSVFLVDFECDQLRVHRVLESMQDSYSEYLASMPRYSDAIEKYIANEVIEEEKAQMKIVTSKTFLENQLKDKKVFMHDFRVIRKGVPVYYRIKFVNISEGSKLTKSVVGFANISSERESQWDNVAFFDQITLGRNYNYYAERLKEETNPGYIVSMDIRAFKMVNDVCGIAKGDYVLQRVSQIIEKVVGNKGYYGHLNADHYVFYLMAKNDDEVIHVIERVTGDIEKFAKKEDLPKIGAYFGVTKWEPGDRIQVIFSEANQAKHRIKNQVKVNYGFYRDEDNAKAIEEKKLEDAFETAIENKEFEVWYQPKYSPVEKELTGAEALIRWRKPDGELISPGKFIPVFEKNGMIRQLDEYVFRTVCRQQKIWIDTIGRTVPISINLSRASLYYENIVEEYKSIAENEGVLAELLPIEITESAAINNADIRGLANRFFEAGFPLHIDDFGTGYSSLSTLNMMRFDTLKLDKTLIDYIGEFGGERLIKHTVALAKDLGLHVTAEGVEKEEQVEFLNRVECDHIQGFVYSRPLPAEFFDDKLVAEKMSDKYMYRKGQVYTYPVIIEYCRRACSNAMAEELQGHAAVQVNITGDGEGAFYIEINHGQVDVQPYEYFDRDALITTNAETFLGVLKGTNSLENAFAEGKLNVDGDWGAALLVQQLFRKQQRVETN